jgi:hypothetical protein
MQPLVSPCLSVGLSVLLTAYNDSGAAELIIVKFYMHCNFNLH